MILQVQNAQISILGREELQEPFHHANKVQIHMVMW